MEGKRKKKIQIIDDDVHYTKKVKFILEINDFEIFTAVNGKAGIKLAMKKQPDVILMDMIMPITDGERVITTLRKKGYPGLFVGCTTMVEEFKKYNPGYQHFIKKPIRYSMFEEFLKELHNILGKV